VFYKPTEIEWGVEALNELAGIREQTDVQVSFGRDTGRKAVQVPLGFVYRYTSSKRSPSTTSLEKLPPSLQSLVRRLLKEFEKENGFCANNVLIQLYEPGAGIGRHPDNTRTYQVKGKILSYHGGQTTRTFVLYPKNQEEIRIKLKPGTILFFWDGDLEHELLKPYKSKGVSKQAVRECASTRPKDKCLYLHDHFACNEECTAEHPCTCPHQLRLNITIRFMEKVKRKRVREPTKQVRKVKQK